MDKISPEEKNTMDEKNSSRRKIYWILLRQNEVYYTTVDKWLRNYKAIGPEAFFSKEAYLSNSCPKKPLFSITFLKVLSGYLYPAQNFRCTDTQKMDYDIIVMIKETGGRAIMTKGRKTTFEERVEIVQYCIKHSHNYSEQQKNFTFLISRPEVIL